MYHDQICEQAADNDRVSTLLKRFLGFPTESSPAYQSCYRSIEDERNQFERNGYHNKEISKVEDLTPASIASFGVFGFYTPISPVWDSPWDTYKHKNIFHHSLLEFAVLGKSAAICARLIGWGAKVDEQPGYSHYGSLLVLAASETNSGMVQVLLQSRTDVNAVPQARGYGSALAAAVRWDNLEVVQLLLQPGADVNAQFQPGFGSYGFALAAGASGGHIEEVHLLLEFGANINAQLQNRFYGSALAAAADRGHVEVVQLLLEFGMEVNAQLQTGSTGSALVAAIEEAKRYITHRIVNWDATNDESKLESSSSRKELVLLLLESRAEVNLQLQTELFSNAIEEARWMGDSEIVQLLLEHGPYERRRSDSED